MIGFELIKTFLCMHVLFVFLGGKRLRYDLANRWAGVMDATVVQVVAYDRTSYTINDIAQKE